MRDLTLCVVEGLVRVTSSSGASVFLSVAMDAINLLMSATSSSFNCCSFLLFCPADNGSDLDRNGIDRDIVVVSMESRWHSTDCFFWAGSPITLTDKCVNGDISRQSETNVKFEFKWFPSLCDAFIQLNF